jgi:long-chain-fatty-acid--[acyl-carrier-protein] ligase
MLWMIQAVGGMLARLVLSMRYRVRLHGAEQLRGLPGPVLILPNHPGYVDPPIVLTTLWPYLHPRPMLYEAHFRNPLLYPLMKVLNALRVPDLTQASGRARRRAERAIQGAIDALRRGENVIMWPSGRTQRGGGLEVLGGVRAVTDILQAVPEARVVLVRTRGVWGSLLSWAYTGEYPHLLRRLFEGAGLLLANLLVLMPRRPVDITVEAVERERLPELRRETLNRWLEDWYNARGAETPTFVPYHFLFGPRTHEFPKPKGLDEVDLARITPETKAEVVHIIERRLNRPLIEGEKDPETTLDQLGMDSLDRMAVTLDVEQRFGFSGEQVPVNEGQLWALAQGLVETKPPKPPPARWFRPPAVDEPARIRGETVPEAFVNRALANPGDVAVADDLSGVLTYQRLLAGALVLARRFAALPAPNVGVMLPASVACDTVLLAVQLAGKLPVLLNWTTGPNNLAHAARLMGLTHVITADRFIDRLGITVEGAAYLYLEDLREEIGRWELLRTLLAVRLFPGRVRGGVPALSPDQPAVVLFTSGSEKAPKAVPLTHRNLLSDQSACVDILGILRRDGLFGFLPAFHSFGMSVTCLLPILSGMRVVHHPDPTAAAVLVRKLAAYRPSILAGTPTFVSYILDRARPEDLASLRMIVVGAEKCPDSLRERCGRLAPTALLLEGYGITECAPVVSANRPTANRPGTVGQAIPGVEVCVTDLDGGAVLPPGRMGMLEVTGPTVFPGYLGEENASPFREHDGKRWYVTGDLGEVDADGFITLSGRLKRFLKAGGEMISLPALEEPFARRYPASEKGPRVAVEGVETPGGRRIVLFTTEPLGLREANAVLWDEGFRGVMRLDEVRQVESISVLGTGKTDYKAYRAQLTEAGLAAGLTAAAGSRSGG